MQMKISKIINKFSLKLRLECVIAIAYLANNEQLIYNAILYKFKLIHEFYGQPPYIQWRI
jgi:hypothetical protein